MNVDHVGRSTVIRRLTMTCRAIRATLLPVLWEDVEGRLAAHDDGFSYGLYDQCEYLLSNPDIAAHVQTFSVDLVFKYAPKDPMKKFVDTLIQLPNLRGLELLSLTHRGPITVGLKRKCTTFPNIHEIIIGPKYPEFVASCPNLESLTFRYGVNPRSSSRVAIDLCGAGLKHVVGIDASIDDGISYVAEDCPDLQEIGLIVAKRHWEAEGNLEDLRPLQNLSVVEINFVVTYDDDELDIGTPHILEERQNAWKRASIDVLSKRTSSRDCKFLRWRTTGHYSYTGDGHEVLDGQDYDIIDSGELEVLPETTL